MLRAETDE